MRHRLAAVSAVTIVIAGAGALVVGMGTAAAALRAQERSAAERSGGVGSLPTGAEQAPTNALTAQQKTTGWVPLFDGTTTSGWRGYRMKTVPAMWKVVDGALTCDPSATGASPGSPKAENEAVDLVTDRKYHDFELVFDWKIQHGGNSGVMYRVAETADAPYETGPEYQVLDDPNYPDGKSLLTSAGSVFGLYAIPRHLARPAGEWNQGRIVVRDAHVEHWLNGVKAAVYVLGSPDFQKRVANSKFHQWPDFGRADSGYIDLQDHGFEVAFRDIRIRELK